MARRRIECPVCKKNRRLFDDIDCRYTDLEIKCKQCGNTWRILIKEDDISIVKAEEIA